MFNINSNFSLEKMPSEAALLRASRSAARRKYLHLQVTRFATEVALPVLTSNIDFTYVKKVSPIEIRKKYGDNCLSIFRLLFSLHQVGGLSRSGQPYVSRWVANLPNLRLFNDAVEARVGTEYSAKMLLADLKAKGAVEHRFVKLDAGPRREISGADIISYKEMVKKLRQWEREELAAQVEQDDATRF
jgi:hypothetical protein